MKPITTPEDHLEQVLSTFAATTDERTRVVVTAAVRHLHGLMCETGLTRGEWSAAIRFLTAVGQRCDDERQEFVLLSDTLGASMLLEMLHDQPAPAVTEPTVLGPFYLPGSAERPMGVSIVDDPDTGGEPMVLAGTVRGVGGHPITGASLDVWQVQPNGLYDIEEHPGKRNLRGLFTTSDDGRYTIGTVRPVDYTIPDDGPVGEMLRTTGRSSWRPAHVHLMVSAPDHRPLVTHVFDAASPHLHDDVVFGVRPSLVASMARGRCEFDVTLAPLGA